MVERPVLTVVAVACLCGAVVWGRSATRLSRARRRLEHELGADDPASVLARSAFRKETHAAVIYAAVALAAAFSAWFERGVADVAFALVLIPVAFSVWFGRDFLRHARLAERRSLLERKAEEVLAQESLAPRRWAARLAPEDVPAFPGIEVGASYQPGAGMMAGDFYDLFSTGPHRMAAVIGDVAGHGIDSSITAFQAKYLLRVFLRQFRDPAQALEELNAQLSGHERGEEFVSLCVVVLDIEMGTLRYASAGHPAALLWHDREVRALEATGPLLTMIPTADYGSREIALDPGDLVVLYTDGLTEARAGDQLFGEERVAGAIRRDPSVEPSVLCKSLLDAARDFATERLRDDVAILALKRA